MKKESFIFSININNENFIKFFNIKIDSITKKYRVYIKIKMEYENDIDPKSIAFPIVKYFKNIINQATDDKIKTIKLIEKSSWILLYDEYHIEINKDKLYNIIYNLFQSLYHSAIKYIEIEMYAEKIAYVSPLIRDTTVSYRKHKFIVFKNYEERKYSDNKKINLEHPKLKKINILDHKDFISPFLEPNIEDYIKILMEEYHDEE